jgi:DNA primase
VPVDLRLAVTDCPVSDVPVKLKCIMPDHRSKDKENSLAVYADHLYCFGCHLVIRNALEALALLLKKPPKDIDVAHYTSESVEAYRERATEQTRRDPLPSMLARLYHELMPHEKRAWYRARGLTNKTIDQYQLGYDEAGERFVIPVFDADGDLLTLRFRRDDACGTDGPKYYGVPGRNGLYLFPEQMLYNGEFELWDSVVLCEGELDALRLWQENIPAASVTNGAGQVHKLLDLLPATVRTIYVATDQDEAGEAAAGQCLAKAKERGLEAVRLTWTAGKDITEAFQLGSLTVSDFAPGERNS